MKGFRGSTWFSVVLLVFLCFVVTFIIMLPLILLGIKHELIVFDGEIRIVPVGAIAVISIVIGTAISVVLGRVIATPIKELSNATKEVAKGNFDVQLEEYDDVGTDLGDIGQLRSEFNKMVRELQGIETLRNDFVANVSHEFKTPIASIEGCAALLQDENLSPEERREYTAIIAASAKRLSTMTTNILQLSKLENQEILPDQEDFALDEQIRQAILVLEPQWSGKNMDLDLELPPVHFFGNSEMLNQVWINLIGNAIKFTGENGTIGIYLSDSSDMVTVRVKDNGIGMDEDTQKRIFDKFYQGNTSHSTEGNGLGLSLVKRIVELSNGTISVKSEKGKGSEFTVSLKHVK